MNGAEQSAPDSHPLTAPVHPPERVTGPPELHHSKGHYPAGRNAGLLALIETPEAMQAYIARGRSQDDVKRRAQRCLQAAELAGRLLNP